MHLRQLLVFSSLVISVVAHAADDGFTPLFNGRNLDGWHVATNGQGNPADQGYFSVTDGTIHVYAPHAAGSTQPFVGLISNESFSNYHLSLEYKWGGKKFAPRVDVPRDAGLCFHLHGEEVIWPNCIELQIQEGDTGDAWIIGSRASALELATNHHYGPKGELLTRGLPKNRYERFPRSEFWEVPGWNRVEIIVQGARAKYLVNGHVVNEVTDLRRQDESGEFVPLTSGRILLQGEGAELFYRDIKIKRLP